MGGKYTPKGALRRSIALVIRRLKYLDSKYPNFSDPAMAKWPPGLSKELQGFVQVLNTVAKESEADISKLVRKYSAMETKMLEQMLRERVENEKAGKESEPK